MKYSVAMIEQDQELLASEELSGLVILVRNLSP